MARRSRYTKYHYEYSPVSDDPMERCLAWVEQDCADRARDTYADFLQATGGWGDFRLRQRANPNWLNWWEREPPPPGPRKPIHWGVKRLVAQAAGGQPGQVVSVSCPRCGATGEIHWYHRIPRFIGLHIDHIKPVSKGGGNEPENLRLLCPRCNISRGNREVA
jgi:5-methylcytosine-specific restriction endonuclease McrA